MTGRWRRYHPMKRSQYGHQLLINLADDNEQTSKVAQRSNRRELWFRRRVSPSKLPKLHFWPFRRKVKRTKASLKTISRAPPIRSSRVWFEQILYNPNLERLQRVLPEPVELAEILRKLTMTTRYTDEEWTSIIRSARETLSDADMMYKAPTLGSEEFTKSIDHQLLNMDARKEDVDRLCEEARTWKFNVRMYFDSELCVFGPCCGDLTDGREQSVCVRPHHVARAVGNLKGSRISVASVVGFHEGTQSMTEKVAEARKAIKDGASEVHMVLNRPLLQGGEYSAAYTDIAAIRSTAPHPIIVGLILETSQLSKGDVVAACKIAAHSKVDFLDTCTTIDGIGTTEDNVRLMKDVVRGQGIKINASGNVQTLRDAVLMLEAGADRLGTTAGISILKEARARVDGLTHSAGFAPSADIARLQRSQHEGDGWLASPSPPVGKPQTKQYFPSS